MITKRMTALHRKIAVHLWNVPLSALTDTWVQVWILPESWWLPCSQSLRSLSDLGTSILHCSICTYNLLHQTVTVPSLSSSFFRRPNHKISRLCWYNFYQSILYQRNVISNHRLFAPRRRKSPWRPEFQTVQQRKGVELRHIRFQRDIGLVPTFDSHPCGLEAADGHPHQNRRQRGLYDWIFVSEPFLSSSQQLSFLL